MNNDHLTAPMLSASMDEVIALRARIEALKAALETILDELDPTETTGWVDGIRSVARAALDKDVGE